MYGCARLDTPHACPHTGSHSSAVQRRSASVRWPGTQLGSLLPLSLALSRSGPRSTAQQQHRNILTHRSSSTFIILSTPHSPPHPCPHLCSLLRLDSACNAHRYSSHTPRTCFTIVDILCLQPLSTIVVVTINPFTFNATLDAPLALTHRSRIGNTLLSLSLAASRWDAVPQLALHLVSCPPAPSTREPNAAGSGVWLVTFHVCASLVNAPIPPRTLDHPPFLSHPSLAPRPLHPLYLQHEPPKPRQRRRQRRFRLGKLLPFKCYRRRQSAPTRNRQLESGRPFVGVAGAPSRQLGSNVSFSLP